MARLHVAHGNNTVTNLRCGPVDMQTGGPDAAVLASGVTAGERLGPTLPISVVGG
jgi:hypothetical protein